MANSGPLNTRYSGTSDQQRHIPIIGISNSISIQVQIPNWGTICDDDWVLN